MAQQVANKLETDSMLIRSGIVDTKQQRFALAGKQGIAEHIAAYQADLIGRNRTEKHVHLAVKRIENLLGKARIENLGDISSARVNVALGQLRDGGMAERTIGHYTRCMKGFSRWAWRNGLSADDPLAILSVKVNVPLSERKHVRRPFSAEELRQLLEHTKTAPTRWNMTGVDRRMLYMVAAGTGFRSNELRSLTVKSFRLDEPAIFLSGGNAKNGKDVVQPIPTALADELKPWLKGRKVTEPAFTMPYLGNVARMLRDDMAYARITYYKTITPGVERRKMRQGDFLRAIDGDGRYADFHALRATYITMLARENVPVKTLQTLARHSDPKLTLNTYATMGISDMTAAVAMLPNLNPVKSAERNQQKMLATGTDNASANADDASFQRAENALKTIGQNVPFGAIACHQESDTMTVRKPLIDAGNPLKSSIAPDGTRTHALRFRKPPLYPTELRARYIILF